MLKRRCAVVLGIAASWVIALGTPLHGAEPVYPFAAWKGVESFTAEATADSRSWIHESDRGSSEEYGDNVNVSYRFNIKRSPGGTRDVTWLVQDSQVRGAVDHYARVRSRWRIGDIWYKATIDGTVRNSAKPPAEEQCGNLSMDVSTGKWNLHVDNSVQKPYREQGHSRYDEFDGGSGKWKVANDQDIDQPDARIPGVFIRGVVPAGAKPGVLTGTAVVDQPGPGPGRGSLRTFRVVMWPTYQDVECVVDLDKYEKWLPAANLAAPGQPGSKLWVKATLKRKDGKPALDLHARRFRFELLDTSHEPGVAMNFPLQGARGDSVPAADRNPDLRLNLGLWSGTVSDQAQKALVDPMPTVDGKDEAHIAVDAFDFGGYANLLVVCELEDGREIPGLLKFEGRTTADITLPKRSDGSKIADHWRKKFKLGPNDAEDLDDLPLGDGNAGDGFSNYEEYRGFVVNGQHVRTAPNTKDLFIQNKIGDAAKPGIWLFRDITDLDVHFKLRASEMPESRIMNANRSAKSPRSSQAPQHGLVLAYGSQDDASFADVMKSEKAWRPGNVASVNILRRLAPLRGQTAILPETMANELDATIAHELCHSIGVYHHGNIDIGWVVWVKNTVVAPNGTEIDYFEERRTVWDATQNKRVASTVPGNFIKLYSSPAFQIKPNSPGDYLWLDTPVWVGVYGGQHSGNDQCVMRYDCAGAYVLPLRPRDRFISPWEPPGMKLCRSYQGTGINDRAADPPRYSDALRGECSHKFAVRDDAPDRNAPEPK